MSLKAKIEAVIYACEEPVTLAQLVGLLGQEAEGELAEIAARQQRLHLAEADEAFAEAPTNESEAESDIPDVQLQTIPDAETELSGASPTAAEKRIAREKERRLRDYLRETVHQLIADYATSDRGLEVREIAGGFRMATKPEYHDAVRGFVKSLKAPLKLTLQALETLAVVAYKQPVTAPEISEIRGVDSNGVLGSLMARKLITTAGRKQVIGRPILYKTTKDFLLRFGLKDVGELPSIEEFEKMANELAEQEEIPMAEGSGTVEERITHENLAEEQHSKAPQADGDDADLNPANGRPQAALPTDKVQASDAELQGNEGESD